MESHVNFTEITRRNLNFNELTESQFVEMMSEDIRKITLVHNASFFDIDIEYNYGPLDSWRIVSVDENIKDNLKRAYKSLKKSKNWEHGTGWMFSCDIDERGRVCFRPKIYIMFNQEYLDNLLEQQSKKAKEISDFYKELNYKGD